MRTRSPSVSRRRPWIRSPLTYVPFCEKPSSQSVHSPALNSSSACSRETSGSHASGTSASSRRPTVTEPARSSSATIRCAPWSSRSSRNGAPPFSASRRASRSSGVARSSASGVSITRLEKMLSSETKMFTIDTKMPVASQIASFSVPCLRR